MIELILLALAMLDPTNDDHWTSDGLPRVDVVNDNVPGFEVGRGDITAAHPKFNRKNTTPLDQLPVADPSNPWAPAEPEVVPEVPSEETPVDHSDVFAALDAARLAFNAASIALRAAEYEADMVISANEEQTTTLAQDIKMFQAAQLKQREAEAPALELLHRLARENGLTFNK